MSANNGDQGSCLLKRDHSLPKCVVLISGISLCITVDILQYSMPLAFLPSVLEDRGHSTFKIASAIGVYYWTGFAGGLLITTYQTVRLYCASACEEQGTVLTAKRHIKFLIAGLFIGTATLTCQALSPRYNVHLACRFIQGFAGAFIFFYAFLLSASLFKAGSVQQDYAMTAAATALNIAEVLGSLFGAAIYDMWGQSSVFWFLGAASVVNQVALVCIIYSLESEGKPLEVMEEPALTWDLILKNRGSGWRRVKKMLSSRRLAVAVLLIVAAAIVKGAVEEMLPFHADHQWGLRPLEIGQLFAVIAFAYICAAVFVGRVWRDIDSHRALRNFFVAMWLALLGLCALWVFHIRFYNYNTQALWLGLAGYGVCLGMTHTPAALLLAEALEHEEATAKEAANGIWNTMWEAGGSMGFLLGGVLAHNYDGQMRLMMGTCVSCIVAAVAILVVSGQMDSGSPIATPRKPVSTGSSPQSAKSLSAYGSA